MFFIFIFVVLLVAPVLAYFPYYSARISKWEERKSDTDASNLKYSRQDPIPEKPKFNAFIFVLSIALAILYLAINMFTVVSAGHIGVQVTLGTVEQQTLAEGAHFVNPLSSVQQVEVRMVTGKLKSASAGTKDLQAVHTDIVVNYRLDGARVAHIYKEFGLDLEDRVIMPATNEAFKAVVARYTSEELITKRDVVSAQIKEELATKLAKYNIGVNDISLVNFAFSVEYQKAIEAKVIATQSKLKAEQDLARIEVEAKQAIARAEGEAKSIQIQTQAINSQGGAAYVQLQAIEKWDGKLPTTNAGVVPFVNIK